MSLDSAEPFFLKLPFDLGCLLLAAGFCVVSAICAVCVCVYEAMWAALSGMLDHELGGIKSIRNATSQRSCVLIVRTR